MSSPAGTRFETAVRDFLKARGLRAVKPVQTKWYDVGDIHVGDDVILQAKAHRDILNGIRLGVAGAKDQAERARRRFGFAVVKRPGKSVASAYVVMSLETLADLLHSREETDEVPGSDRA